MGVGELVLIAALVGAAVLVAAGSAAGLAAGLGSALILAAWVGAQPARLLRLSGARRAEPREQRRLVNLAQGLARDAGVGVPELWVTPSGPPNQFVCRSRGRAHLAVTAELLETFSRTELEAVIAHGLGRLRRPLLVECLSSGLGQRVPGAPPLVGVPDDLWAVSLTRYPPALAAALDKAGRPGRLSAFWFLAEGPTHEPRERRRALLDEL